MSITFHETRLIDVIYKTIGVIRWNSLQLLSNDRITEEDVISSKVNFGTHALYYKRYRFLDRMLKHWTASLTPFVNVNLYEKSFEYFIVHETDPRALNALLNNPSDPMDEMISLRVSKMLESSFTDIQWNWGNLTKFVNFDFIQSHIHLSWDTVIIKKRQSKYSQEQATSLDFEKQCGFSLDYLSLHPALIYEILLNPAHSDWLLQRLWLFPCIDYDVLAGFSQDFSNSPFLHSVFATRNITPKFVQKYKKRFKKWIVRNQFWLWRFRYDVFEYEKYVNRVSFKHLSGYRYLKTSFVVQQQNSAERDWDVPALMSNSAFFMRDIDQLEKAGIPIDYKYLSSNPNLTYSYILEHKQENWDEFELSRNPFHLEHLRERFRLVVRRVVARMHLNESLIPDISSIILNF